MQQEMRIEEHTVAYTLRKSPRARYMRLTVYHDGAVVVTTPLSFSPTAVERFVRKKARWLLSTIAFFKAHPVTTFPRSSRAEYRKQKEAARTFAEQRLAHFNAHYGFRFHRVSIRNQKSRWGSCSKKGNLNFNYKIALLPAHLADYIIVHELCHLKAFDHSRAFWALVGEMIPDARERRRALRRIDVRGFVA